MKCRKATIDDGCNPELLVGAELSGTLETPVVHAPDPIVIPEGFTPYSRINRMPSSSEMVCFFEHDPMFAEVLIDPKAHVAEFAAFPMITQLDCSVYRDMPLGAQLTNIYRSRVVAAYFQRCGANVWPLARWGDERTYTDLLLPEAPAFCGIEASSPVVVSGYGCSRGKENQFYFQEGLESLVDTVRPELILLYGTPQQLVRHVMHKTEVIHYPDWTSRMKGGR
jgi:hypothetical protein